MIDRDGVGYCIKCGAVRNFGALGETKKLWRNPEYRVRQSTTQSKYFTLETKAKQLIHKHQTAEHRAKISEAIRKSCKNKEVNSFIFKPSISPVVKIWASFQGG